MPFPGRRVTVLLTLLVFAAAAPRGQSPPQAAPPQAAPSLEGYPKVGTPAIVKLTNPGAEPRLPVRYRVPTGHKSTMVMSTSMNMTMTLGEFAAPATDLPTMKMTAEVAVTGVAPNGDITYDLAFTGMTAEALPGMDPGLVAKVQASAASITAMKGTITVSNRGVNRSARLDAGKVADPGLRQMLESLSTSIESMSTPVPEEAVGVGARWEVRQAFQSAGTHIFQRAEYEVVSIDAGSVTLRVTTEQTAPRQMVSNPALPAGATMEVEKITGTGTGTMTLRFDQLVPTGEISSASAALMNASMAGQTQRMKMDTTLKMTIGPVK